MNSKTTRLKVPAEMSTTVRLFGMLLMVAIVASALFSIVALRNKEIDDWRRNLKSLSFMLTEHTFQTVVSAFLVLDSITERVRETGVDNEAAFRARLSAPDFHQLLHDKIQGLPQLDVASVVAANGDNLNFSRTYPVPPINLAERDYFKAHRDNPRLGDHISTAVRNKGNGKWTFYISRRIDDAQGRFMGLVLVGLSVEALTGVYERLAQNLGEGASITLYRNDLTALARAPHKDDVIGRVNKSGSTYDVIAVKKAREAVVMVDTPRFSSGLSELRLSAVSTLDRYPLVISLVVPESIFLADWRQEAVAIAGMGLLSIAFVLMGIVVITRSARRREQTERELRESEAKFHTMVDWATDWEYWIRSDRHIHYMTPSAEPFTGYRVEEFERTPGLIETLIHPEDRALWIGHAASIETDRDRLVEPMDLRIIQKNGAVRWVSHVCRPVYGPGNVYLGRRVTMRDITDRKSSEDEIRQLAYFDALTRLPNRRLFLDRLGHALRTTGRMDTCGALLMLDLDHFKKLNDTQGHDVGDRLLIEVAQRLASTVRETDTVSRLGGDEFAIMIEGLSAEESVAALQAEQIAEKIHAVLNRPYTLNETTKDHRSSPSIGMTLFQGDSQPLEVLMKQADVALYQAKDAGRNAIRFFNPAMQAMIDGRTAMENALRRALMQGHFQLHYQPQIDAHGRRIGAEALIRWIDPVRGMIPPAQFIALAEETGLIIDIGQWVIDTACEQLRRWAEDPRTRALQISVNVSARQFHQLDFVDRIRKSLSSSGADPQCLMLELTESIVVDRVDEVIARMERLHDLGVNFSLDDFGTGYSSLSYLKRLPLDEVKIDRSFVHDLVEDRNDAAIVRAILAMSQSLGLRVVAEGVETPAQHDFLLRNGCTTFQGYLFGKPAPIEAWDLDADARQAGRQSASCSASPNSAFP